MLRLHHGLLEQGEQSYFVTWEGIGGAGSQQASIIRKLKRHLLPRLDTLPLKLYSHRDCGEFNLQWVPGTPLNAIRKIDPDIVHIHWVGRGFVRVEDFARINRPIVWTLHDSWAFTGGCYVPDGCTRFLQACGECPQLGSKRPDDVSHRLWERKSRAWENVPMTLVSPSRWLAGCASKSTLLAGKRLEVIANGLDLNSFKPTDMSVARDLLGLPREKFLLLFGAISPRADKNKGFNFLRSALDEVFKHMRPDRFELIVVGASRPPGNIDLGIPIRFMGRLHDDISIRLHYCAADITLVPSIQENLPQMAVESISCGTPVVAFNATGFTDIITHRENGYLASAYDERDLGNGIVFILNHPDRGRFLKSARCTAEKKFSIDTMTERYKDLYRMVL